MEILLKQLLNFQIRQQIRVNIFPPLLKISSRCHGVLVCFLPTLWNSPSNHNMILPLWLHCSVVLSKTIIQTYQADTIVNPNLYYIDKPAITKSFFLKKKKSGYNSTRNRLYLGSLLENLTKLLYQDFSGTPPETVKVGTKSEIFSHLLKTIISVYEILQWNAKIRPKK